MPVNAKLYRHLETINAGGFEFAFQMLLLLLRRELQWEQANQLWDALLAWHQLLHVRLAAECDSQCHCRGETCVAEDNAAFQHEYLSVLMVSSAGCVPRYPSYSRDVFRELRIAAAAALLLAHRTQLLKCTSVEAVVQLANQFHDTAPGSGVKLAYDAASLMQHRIQGKPDARDAATASCGCI